jgi:Uncharacterized protein conserved in bacteria (DUF2141)
VRRRELMLLLGGAMTAAQALRAQQKAMPVGRLFPTNRQKNSPRRLLALAPAHGSGASRPADRHDPRHPQLPMVIFTSHSSQSHDGFPAGGFFHPAPEVKGGSRNAKVDDLAPGTYAVGAYHDQNNNRRLDTDFTAYPTEGYALSNGITRGDQPPSVQRSCLCCQRRRR